MIESLNTFWIQIAPILLQMVLRAKDIVLAPIFNPELIWVLLPVYINWLISDFMTTKASFNSAASAGFTYLWVGTSWLREYFQHLRVGIDVILDNVTINVSKFLAVANPFELGVVLAMFFYGLITMWFAVTGREVSKFMGDTRTEAFLLIVITPILFRIIPFDIVTITAMVFLALVFYIVVEIIYRIIHPKSDKSKKSKSKKD